ncbi:MAG: hypothetical protein KIS73_15680 [Enhydrobacter sp.]|nr:hypothetical protein [Enhydrobacter sp.]
MRQKANFLEATRTTDYESMVSVRRWRPWHENFTSVARTFAGLFVIAALFYGTWILADLIRPAGSSADALSTVSASR